MIDLHGIVYAYHSYPALYEIVSKRTSASLPFCSRYRLIDFALSSMTNAGVRDVGVIMQRNYQSLLDHLEGGKDWDLSRGGRSGLHLMPPYGTHGDSGVYRGCMEALSAMLSYILNIKQDSVVLFRGDLAANIDLKDVYENHISSGKEITAVCAKTFDSGTETIRFIQDENGDCHHMHFRNTDSMDGSRSTEVYIIQKHLLVEMIEWSRKNGKLHFHRDALSRYFKNGGLINLYFHNGYASHIRSIQDYYNANIDMLNSEHRASMFPENRPVYTKGRSSVSTFYGMDARANNSLIADGCYIEGEVKNCVLFRGVKVEKGSFISDCVIMQDSIVNKNVRLNCIIADKNVLFPDNTELIGNKTLPTYVPKGTTI